MISRRTLLRATCSAALFTGLLEPGHGKETAVDDLNFSSRGATDIAAKLVARESPHSVWPFERPDPSHLQASPRKVFCHYLTPFPLSFDNKPLGVDYYQRQYLRRDGEHRKFERVGGYLRERPLSSGVWPQADWRLINAAIEVFRGHQIGLDAFGVDWMRVDHGPLWTIGTALLGAAEASGTGFRILIEPDTATLTAHSVTVDALVRAVEELNAFSSVFRLEDGRLLLAPFAAEIKPAAFWQAVLKELERKSIPTALLPIFLDQRKDTSAFPAISYGLSLWGPRDARSAAVSNTAHAFTASDLIWMEPIAPQDARPKSSVFWEAGNTELFRLCWAKAINGTATYAHIITWNDYSEASEIAPSTGIQYLFYDLAAYYIAWFKLRRAPRITRDAIYYSHRRQIFASPRRLARTDDVPLQVVGRTPLQNRIEMIAMLTEPATLEIRIGAVVRTLEAPAGLSVLTAPAQVGRPRFRILHRNNTVTEIDSHWEIADELPAEDPLYVGGSNTRQFTTSAAGYR